MTLNFRIFCFLNINRPHYGPGFDSVSNRNAYQGYLLGSKGGGGLRLTTVPPSCADCLEFLEASTSWSPKDLYMLV